MYFIAYNAWKRCRKKKDGTGQNFMGILNRFLKDPQYRESQEQHGWDEAKCEGYDKLAQEDHSYTLTRSEHLRYSSKWTILLNSSGPNKPMATRPDYRAAVQLEKSTTPVVRRNPRKANPSRKTTSNTRGQSVFNFISQKCSHR